MAEGMESVKNPKADHIADPLKKKNCVHGVASHVLEEGAIYENHEHRHWVRR
jgi:hypothetical protein